MLRDHQPITINDFNGLYQRGDKDSTPLDHFSDCLNIKYIGQSSFGTRDGLGISQDVIIPLSNVRRVYNYPRPDGNNLIALTVYNGIGKIYHLVSPTLVYGPILTIAGMTDFAFLPYAGRGYISPFSTFVTGDLNIEKGLENEVLYVYMGTGNPARPAAGNPLTGNITIANGAAGHTDPGLHIFGFVAETDSGYLTAPGVLETFTTISTNSVSFGSVPTSGSPTIVKRHLVASKVITNYNGDTLGYQLFFVPNATINDNTTTFLNDINFFDADLLEDASHLLDNYASIPAGAVLSLYHNRLVLATTFDDISLAIVSAPGEPEAINQIDGLLILTPDSNPITNAQDLRDVLYVTKRAGIVSYVDNGDIPSSWLQTVIDNALGTSVHGAATVLDTGTSSVDYLMLANYQGISLFNGKFVTPELSWKVENFWRGLDRNDFGKIQIVISVIPKEIYCVLPDGNVLVGNYANGLDPKKIRWTIWSYSTYINSVAIHNIDEIVFGADLF